MLVPAGPGCGRLRADGPLRGSLGRRLRSSPRIVSTGRAAGHSYFFGACRWEPLGDGALQRRHANQLLLPFETGGEPGRRSESRRPGGREWPGPRHSVVAPFATAGGHLRRSDAAHWLPLVTGLGPVAGFVYRPVKSLCCGPCGEAYSEELSTHFTWCTSWLGRLQQTCSISTL